MRDGPLSNLGGRAIVFVGVEGFSRGGPSATVSTVGDEGQVNRPSILLDGVFGDAEVEPFDIVRPEHRLEWSQRFGSSNDKENPRRLAVKPMDDSDVGARDAPISHQVAAHPLQESIRFACLGGLGGHSGRLVNDEDMRIFVKNTQPPLDDLAARAVRMMRDQSVGSDLQSKFLHAIAVQIDLPTPESLLGSPT
jgi:hypothetical protein